MNKFLLPILALLIISCGSVKELKKSPLKNRSAANVLKKMEANAMNYDWFSAKLSGKLEIDGVKTPVSASLRMRKDSIIWVSLSALLGIEIVRVRITPDSLQMINRLNSTYWKGSVEEVQEKFGIPFRYNDLQNLLVGQVNFSKQLKFKSRVLEDLYLLSSKNKKSPFQIRLWTDSRFLPKRYELHEDNGRLMQVKYQAFEKQAKQWVPSQMSILFSTTKEQLEGSFKYSKIYINTPKKVKFLIPDSYAPMD
ncbi:MAG: DUF4292 domain-containing protein [Bacteroidetes bacterium]|nr:DUF4292 domain-containing protein [Bacteroidota bacterium]